MGNSIFNIDSTIKTAVKRMGKGLKSRKSRSDAGSSRISSVTRDYLMTRLDGFERPVIKELISELTALCRKKNEPPPSRVTVYRLIENLRPPEFSIDELPRHVRETLYNLDDKGVVPGHQLAFYCFNYGGLEAISFAAGLPWICLYQAAKMSGYRPGGRGLLDAVIKTRGI